MSGTATENNKPSNLSIERVYAPKYNEDPKQHRALFWLFFVVLLVPRVHTALWHDSCGSSEFEIAGEFGTAAATKGHQPSTHVHTPKREIFNPGAIHWVWMQLSTQSNLTAQLKRVRPSSETEHHSDIQGKELYSLSGKIGLEMTWGRFQQQITCHLLQWCFMQTYCITFKPRFGRMLDCKGMQLVKHQAEYMINEHIFESFCWWCTDFNVSRMRIKNSPGQ